TIGVHGARILEQPHHEELLGGRVALGLVFDLAVGRRVPALRPEAPFDRFRETLRHRVAMVQLRFPTRDANRYRLPRLKEALPRNLARVTLELEKGASTKFGDAHDQAAGRADPQIRARNRLQVAAPRDAPRFRRPANALRRQLLSGDRLQSR